MIWYLMQLMPDQFVVLDGFNDFYYSFTNDGLYIQGINPYHQTQYDWLNSNMNVKQSVSFLLNQLIDASYFLKMVNNQFKKMASYQPQTTSEVTMQPFYISTSPKNYNIDEALRNYQHNLKTMIGVAKANDIGISIFFQPSLTREQKQLSDAEKTIMDEADIVYKQHNNNGKSFFQVKNDWFDNGNKIVDQLRGKFSAHNVKISNLAPIFKYNSETVYGDHCHYTDAGNNIIADAMLDSVMSVLKNSVNP